MTTVVPRPCYSLFSDDNKFSLSKLNGDEPLAVTAFILEPVPAVAIMDDSDEESSDEESSDEEDVISELTQIVTCVDREQLVPDEEDSEANSDDEDILLGNSDIIIGNPPCQPSTGPSLFTQTLTPRTTDAVSEERREVAAALASISEYEDEKFTELAEQLKKAKLLKDAGLIDDAHVQVELGWTRMNLYIR